MFIAYHNICYIDLMIVFVASSRGASLLVSSNGVITYVAKCSGFGGAVHTRWGAKLKEFLRNYKPCRKE